MFINWKGLISSIAVSSLILGAPLASGAANQNISSVASTIAISELKPSEKTESVLSKTNFKAVVLNEQNNTVEKMTAEEFKKLQASKGIISIKSLTPSKILDELPHFEYTEVKVLGEPKAFKIKD